MKTILEEDFDLLNERIKVLEKQMFDLGEDFNEAVSQSSETWHDNAPFDAVRDRQSILNFELVKLRTVRKEAVKINPKPTKQIQIGAKVVLRGPKIIKVMIGGHWIGRERVGEYALISCESPIAIKLLGKKLGDRIEIPCLLYTSPSPRDGLLSRMPSSA